jgi:dihydrolipoamide dehydrogenase
METFDVVVIGAGPGGYPAAIRAAQLGASTAVVEKEALGGTCLNWGCIPTKTLLAAGDLFARIHAASEFGIRVPGAPAVDYPAMVDRKDRVVATLRGGVEQLLKANGVKVIKGTASFLNRGKIAVAGAGEIGAKKAIIASGTVSAVPGFLPKHERVMDSRAILAMRTLPASALILGAGIIGCEFACLLANLGVKVTVVELLEDIMMVLDADVRREARRHMEQIGVRFITGKSMESVSADNAGVRASAGGEALAADILLVAVGRKPETAALKLENAGIKADKSGLVEIDEYGATSAANIYAVGDVTKGPQLAHRATSMGLSAAANACGKNVKNEALVPSCIFTSPEIGTAGMSEADAAAQNRAVKVGKFPFIAVGRALAVGETGGFVKWIADAETEQLLGAAVVGMHATELIAEAAAAIRSEQTAHEVGRTIHCHPTLSEAWMEAADVLTGEPVHVPPKKKR